jgi:ribosomal protein S3AE
MRLVYWRRGKIEHEVNLGVATRRGYQIRAQPLSVTVQRAEA